MRSFEEALHAFYSDQKIKGFQHKMMTISCAKQTSTAVEYCRGSVIKGELCLTTTILSEKQDLDTFLIEVADDYGQYIIQSYPELISFRRPNEYV